MARQAVYKRYTRSKVGNVVYLIFLIMMSAFSVIPFIYTICTAFKPLDELLIFPPRFFVHRPTFENFTVLPTLLESLRVPFSRYITNSIVIAGITTILNIIISSLAAFSLSKSQLKGKSIIFLIIQFSLLYNATTLAIPQYIVISKMKIIDTLWVYILPALASSMGVFLMKQYIDSSVPNSLMEAAEIDGANPFKIYWEIIMPLAKPGWMTLFLFSFQGIWSITPSSGTIYSEQLKTLPTVLASIAIGGTARSGSAMATSVLMMIFPIAVYFITQSNIMETMSTSGMKG